MKKLAVALMVVLATTSVFAIKSVNSRIVPEKEDFSAFGDAYQFKLYDSLWTEILPILPSGRNGDGVDVDSAKVGSGYLITKIDTVGSSDTLLIIFGGSDSLIIAKDR